MESSTGISFKVKVEANEGIWVDDPNILYNIIAQKSVMDNISSTYVSASTGIDFGAISSDTNGKGVYLRAGTQNDTYPIYYYRGAVEDNNVIFNNKCWKAVRTTDTGGVKLIYNGAIGNIYDKVALSLDQYTIVTNTDGTNANVWTFDSTDSSWNASYTTGNLELSFKVPAGDNYFFEVTGQNGSSGSGGYTIYKGGNSVYSDFGGGDNVFALNYQFGTLTADDVVKFSFSGWSFTTPSTFKIKMMGSGDLITENGCDNTGESTLITQNGTNIFPFSGVNSSSPAYVGYMYGETVYDVYDGYDASPTSGAYFGTGFTWDGTNYRLTNAKEGSDDTHHYTCNLTTAEGTCTSIRYYAYIMGYTSSYAYMTLSNGKSIEDAIAEMQTNTVDSNAKTQIDAWYRSNMTGVTNKLEDTIWCNDRSTSDLGGYNPNGGPLVDYTSNLYYGAYQRSNSSFNNATRNQPSLACANKNDRFTVSNSEGNRALTFPVAMLTADEMVLAGGVDSLNSGNVYLNSGIRYWSLSPSYFDYSFALLFDLEGGMLNSYSSVSSYSGLRPSVSLKPGTPVVSGDGTTSNPFRIGN